MSTRINAFVCPDRIVTDFGEGSILAGEDERSAAIRIYRSWCLDTPGDTVEPDPNPEVIVHSKNFQDFK